MSASLTLSISKSVCLLLEIAALCGGVPLVGQTVPLLPLAALSADEVLPEAALAQPPQPSSERVSLSTTVAAGQEVAYGSAGMSDSAWFSFDIQDAANKTPQTNQTSQANQPANSEQTEHQKAEEEVKEQEKQRVVGVVPIFNVTYDENAATLSPGQKMNLSLYAALDWFTVASAFAEAGYHEADNDLVGFPWGPEGFFERTGVAYLDSFDGTILSTGVVPIIFHQDPRYFRMGYGSIHHRMLYALSTSFIAKYDYTGKWGPNYGNLLGNLAAGGLSNLYYPPGNTSLSLTFSTFTIQIAEGVAGSVFQEFWPDLSRKFLHRDPTHGADAARKAAEAKSAAAKQAAAGVGSKQ